MSDNNQPNQNNQVDISALNAEALFKAPTTYLFIGMVIGVGLCLYLQKK